MSNLLSLIEEHIGFEDGLDVNNPATGEKLATVEDFSLAKVESVIKKAGDEFSDWSALTAKQRHDILLKWFELVTAHSEELARLVTAECGKPLVEARGEVAYGASFIEWFAEEARRSYGDVIPSHAPGKSILTTKHPVGVVSAITPWNFPVAMITRKVAPALAAGCTIIVKPAEATPLSAIALQVLAERAGVPSGAFSIVTTGDPVSIGHLLTTHPTIRKVSFTGSTAVGKILMKQAADTVKRVSMELGGNAPFIVFDDADLEAAIVGAMASKFRNAGQTCVCANRFYVQDGIHDAFVKRFTEEIEALTVGDGASEDVKIGPLINEVGMAKVGRLVDAAVEAGATVVTGGGPHEAGAHFYRPTLLSGVTGDMDIARAEIFGPVAPIYRFSSEAEAIGAANDTPYGLAAYMYTRDLGRTFRISAALEYGMVAVNEGILSTEVAPFGGVKESGIGREGARAGLDEYLETKYCLIGGLEE